MKKLFSLISIILISITVTHVYNTFRTNERDETIQLLSTELQSMQADKTMIMELLDIVEDRLASYRIKINELELDLANNAIEIDRLNKHITDLTIERDNLNQIIVQKDVYIAELEALLAFLRQENTDLKEDIKKLQEANKNLQDLLNAANDRIAELEAHECDSTASTNFQSAVLGGTVFKYSITTPPGTNSSSNVPVGGGFRVVKQQGNGNKYIFIFHSKQIYGTSVSLMNGERVLATVTHTFERDTMYLVTFNTNFNLAANNFYLRDSGNRSLHSDNKIYDWSWLQIEASIKYNAFIFY